ncbi:MAG TPA: class I SAM-dependent methyltransferase [Armatimonadota bacterium]|jgi:O-methyltransferase involved in polyketide biosynthesis
MATTYEKIDVTAKLAAYMRQFTDIPFADDVAEYVQANAAFDAMLRKTGLKPEQFTWYAPIFEARYKSIAAVLRKSGIRQAIELASGLSLRGLAMTRDPALTYIETDMPAITAEKTALVADIRRKRELAPTENYRIVSADATDPAQLAAVADGLEVGPVAIINEGLMQYLTRAELRSVAAIVHDVLDRFGGIWITPDFSFVSQETDVSEQQKAVRRAVSGEIDRDMYECAFADEAALQAFFDETGFQADVRNQVDEAGRVVSVTRLNLPSDTLERLRPKLRLWVLHSTTALRGMNAPAVRPSA